MPIAHTPATNRLTALLDGDARAYEANFSTTFLTAARAAYAQTFATWQRLLAAELVGVVSLTLHTADGQTVTLPMPTQQAGELHSLLMEHIEGRLLDLQHTVLKAAKEEQNEIADEAATSDKAQVLALCLPAGRPLPTPTPLPFMLTPTAAADKGTAASE